MKRRFFLQGFGGAMVAAPLLSTLVQKGARAQSTAPVRNIIFFTHNGCNTNKWFPAIEDGALTASDLSPTLQPLSDVVHKLLIPRGYKSLNPYGQRQAVDPHNQAMGSKLTCATIEEGRETNYATGKSVDHEMAAQMNQSGVKPLLLSVGQRSTSIKEVVSFSDAATPHVSEVNPALVYAQLTNVLSTASSGGGVPAPVSEADYKLLRGQSVLDLIKDDLSRYQALNMAQPDKLRIEAWAEMLRKAEMDLMTMGSSMGAPPVGGGSLAGASCNTDFAAQLGVTEEAIAAAGTGVSGERSGAFVFTQQATDEMKQSFTVGGDMMLNLIALSAVCDTNRVMGMIYPGYVIFDWDGISHQYDHHGISHRDGTLDVDNQCVDGVMNMIAEIDNWYAGKYAKLVKLLDSIPEGDVTILDNSATIWLPELSDGDAHNLNNLPIAIAGSAGGKLKQGMAVNVESGNVGAGGSENGCNESQNTSGFTGSMGGNVPINKLYCALMNAYGMTTADGGEWTEWGQFDNDNKNGEAFTNPGQSDELFA
jgi:Protein of unknown function (DUF1552)